MVQAVDLDDKDGTSTSNFLSFSEANNIPPSLALQLNNYCKVTSTEVTDINL
jgi:hypothetical protein